MTDSATNEHKRVALPAELPDLNPQPEEELSEVSYKNIEGVTPLVTNFHDSRERVQDASIYPWIAHLTVELNGKTFPATGWFIAPRTLITAGHVVFEFDDFLRPGELCERGVWASRIIVSPGRNGSASPVAVQTNIFFADARWVCEGSVAHDYGAIIIETDIPGVTALPLNENGTGQARISGYPRLRPNDENNFADGELWEGRGQIVANQDQRFVFYDVDTTNGQSGSPVIVGDPGSFRAVSVHARGGTAWNHGVRLSPRVLDNFGRWINAS